MAATYDSIQTVSLSSTQATVSFTSIPQTYTDLILTIQPVRGGTGTDILAQFNSDTGANYTRITYYTSGTNATTLSTMVTGATSARFNYSTAARTNGSSAYQIHFGDYSGTVLKKNIFSQGILVSNTEQYADTTTNWWNNSNAITRIDLFQDGDRIWGAGSIFSLYGIKRA